MTINAKLLEQEQIITDLKEATKKLKSALKMVLKSDDSDVREDGVNPKEAQSGMSDIIDHHNSMISECKDEIDGILSMLDLEF